MSRWLQASRAAAGFRNKNGARPQPDPNGYTHMQTNVQPLKGQVKIPVIREGFQTLTPSDAAAILENCSYDRQRKIDTMHSETLREMMQRGAWLEKSQIDFGRMSDGKIWLVNGHHRLTAQTRSGRSLLWAIAVHDCKTVDDLRTLYYRYDTNVRKRTSENILQGVDFSGQHGLSKQMARALFDAAPIIASGMTVGTRNPTLETALARRLTDERIAIAERFVAEASIYEKCIDAAPANLKRKLLLPTIAAVALVTIRHEAEIAAEFWSGLAENDGLRRGDSRATLIQDLLARNGKSGSAHQFLVAAAKAWNAYHSGRLLKIIKVNSGHTTKISGTPYEVTA